MIVVPTFGASAISSSEAHIQNKITINKVFFVIHAFVAICLLIDINIT
jgi:hypothetical protein